MTSESSKIESQSHQPNLKLHQIEIVLYLLLGASFALSFVAGSIIVFLAALLGLILVYHVIRNRLTGNAREILKIRPKSDRLEWLDAFRGLVVIFLIIASVTWIMSGKRVEGVPDPTRPPIGPTYLNHGWKYASVGNGWPEMITIIDIGQQILMFVMGFVATIAYYSHVEKEGELAAFLHFLRRFVALIFLSIVIESNFFATFNPMEWSLVSVFWTSTFPNLAWGGLMANLLLRFMKRKPDQRLVVAVLIMIVHSILFEIPSVQAWEWVIDEKVIFRVPWNTINHISIAILGTCAYDWYTWNTDDDKYKGWRERILPVGAICFAANYLWDFLQPAEHHDATTALSLNAIATSLFMLFIFYSFYQVGFKIPALNVLGKNLLLMFLLTGAWDPWLSMFDHAYLAANPVIAMLVVGVIPIILSWLIAWILDKKKIIIKF
jgi:hypothetical protein